MSVSQKHSGKVLVPWANSDEWRQVFELIYSNDRLAQEKALHYLTIWKLRMPLLSAGVEGSLIILEALLIDKENYKDKLANVYAVALMRFLNLCATNSGKQGTFYLNAKQNNLPRWLINLRHDIAHDHKLPSLSMLELGLNFSLNWLKTKYWVAQNSIVSDFVVEEKTTNNQLVIEALNIYTECKWKSYSNRKLPPGLIRKIRRLIGETDATNSDLIDLVEELLIKRVEKSGKFSAAEIATNVVNTRVLFAQKDDNQLSKLVCQLWAPLLNICYINGILFAILDELFNVTICEHIDSDLQIIASNWILEIFVGLLKTRTIKDESDKMLYNSSEKLDPKTSRIVIKAIIDKNPTFVDSIDFDVTFEPNLLDAVNFQERVLRQPNVYTSVYLEKVLIYNHSSTEFLQNALKLVENFNYPLNNCEINEILYLTNEMEIEPSLVDNEMEVVGTNILIPQSSKWKLIKDTSKYQGCPLGILPHQRI